MSCESVGCGNNGFYRGRLTCSCQEHCFSKTDELLLKSKGLDAVLLKKNITHRGAPLHECCSDSQAICKDRTTTIVAKPVCGTQCCSKKLKVLVPGSGLENSMQGEYSILNDHLLDVLMLTEDTLNAEYRKFYDTVSANNQTVYALVRPVTWFDAC